MDSPVFYSPRVKQSELFDRWRSLQMCKWAMNISEANQFKYLCLIGPAPGFSPCHLCRCSLSCKAQPQGISLKLVLRALWRLGSGEVLTQHAG